MADLRGVYYDPNHGGCVRLVEPMGRDLWRVTGAYGSDEAGAPGAAWHADVKVTCGKFLTVDFHGKVTHHARTYRALWCPSVREIHWEDGNVWKKMWSSYDV